LGFGVGMVGLFGLVGDASAVVDGVLILGAVAGSAVGWRWAVSAEVCGGVEEGSLSTR